MNRLVVLLVAAAAITLLAGCAVSDPASLPEHEEPDPAAGDTISPPLSQAQLEQQAREVAEAADPIFYDDATWASATGAAWQYCVDPTGFGQQSMLERHREIIIQIAVTAYCPDTHVSGRENER